MDYGFVESNMIDCQSAEHFAKTLSADKEFSYFNFYLDESIHYFNDKYCSNNHKKQASFKNKFHSFSFYVRNYTNQNDLDVEESRKVTEILFSAYKVSNKYNNMDGLILTGIGFLAKSTDIVSVLNKLSTLNLPIEKTNQFIKNYIGGLSDSLKFKVSVSNINFLDASFSENVNNGLLISIYEWISSNCKDNAYSDFNSTLAVILDLYSDMPISEKSNTIGALHYLCCLDMYLGESPSLDPEDLNKLLITKDKYLEYLYGSRGKSISAIANSLGVGAQIEYWNQSLNTPDTVAVELPELNII